MGQDPVGDVIEHEFVGAKLGDARLEQRLTKVVRALAAAPSKGFPQVMASSAELEALYRLLRNERVQWRAILDPHLRASSERCRAAGLAVMVHDTTMFAFGGDSRTDSVGRLEHGHPGFFGHFALALTADKVNVPLGVVAVRTFRRDAANALPKGSADKRPFEAKEAFRWAELAEEAAGNVGAMPLIHVMDREADDYILLSRLVEGQHRFVIRAVGDRNVLADTDFEIPLSSAMERVKRAVFRTVDIGARAKKPGNARKMHPERDARLARLKIRARAVTFLRPKYRTEEEALPSLTINIVEVFESKPPHGEEPIRWVLMTTEPIETKKQLAQVVDFYRARWRIEEFFKSLKTGCSFEKRQLETEHALHNALALLAPMAWRLLLIRDVARHYPNREASTIFTQDELKLLRHLSKRVKLPESPTTQDALLAIAGLGGHLKNNGPPGWLTLGRGYHDFAIAYAGWLARGESDQS
jgi:hypothetical protein